MTREKRAKKTMSPDQRSCQSCGMPIESGAYCQYCVGENGELQEFEERFARMVQFMKRRQASLTQAEAEAKTLDYMATMPAWRDHPRVVGRG